MLDMIPGSGLQCIDRARLELLVPLCHVSFAGGTQSELGPQDPKDGPSGGLWVNASQCDVLSIFHEIILLIH